MWIWQECEDYARACEPAMAAVLGALARKPCPYILHPYDTGKATDYNADYTWHAVDKERRWDLPMSNRPGIINPNSDIFWTIGFTIDRNWRFYNMRFRPVLHLADLIVYEVDLEHPLRCEVAFVCVSSDTVVASVQIANTDTRRHQVDLDALYGRIFAENPPSQRYVLPGQKFGSGVTTTTGGSMWRTDRPGFTVTCFQEWVRGTSTGQRLLATLMPAPGRGAGLHTDKVRFRDATSQAVSLEIAPSETAAVAFALNLHRFTLGDTWNPPIAPELYRKETEQEAVEAGYRACVEALEDDLEEAIRRSLEPYRTFPKVTLPIESWEADFCACLELPRASTFSPYGSMKTPFYNFCRVHAHDPFGWWSYGMHAHESLCTLFQNIVDPRLSQQFLLGHIRHQRENGMYPYGVGPTIDPWHSSENATAPLIIWEAWNAYLWSGDIEFLREAFESGKRSHEWWLRERDRCGEGLCHWLDTSVESVRDDDSLATWQATGGSQNQEALDLNCYLLVQERTLSLMAGELERLADVSPSPPAPLPQGEGRRESPSPQPSPARGEGEGTTSPPTPLLGGEGSRYAELAGRRAKLMNAYMWHEEDRCYYGINEVEPGWARVKDISTFFPLWAKLAPAGRFERIVELVTDPETFGTPYGPPVLAANEPGFGPEAHWKGANWVEMTMFVIDGLKRYGYYRLAADLAYQNTKMVFDELEKYGHFREYFNSIEGNGVDLIDYIWTAMPAHFIVNVFFGVEPTADGLSIMPSLPADWTEISIERLQVRGKRVSVRVTLDDSVVKTQALINGQPARVTGNRGVFIPWSELADGMVVEITQPTCLTETYAAPSEAPTDWSDVPPHEYV